MDVCDCGWSTARVLGLRGAARFIPLPSNLSTSPCSLDTVLSASVARFSACRSKTCHNTYNANNMTNHIPQPTGDVVRRLR